MVQMKVGIRPIFASLISSFISHMVQMKVTDINSSEVSRLLYIPHGSDES